ncbi:MAG: insulinase family protein [Flavobacteriales bacterium]|nr:insulinase family protein [Flavobacteriales bacterium]
MKSKYSLFRYSTAAGLLLVGVLYVISPMYAQVDRTLPPPPGPAPTVHLGEHSSFTLENGMRVIVVENHKLPMVSVQVRFDIPPFAQGEKAGFVDLISELLMSGTATLTKSEIDEVVDRNGASVSSSNDGIYASTLKKNLEPILTLVEEVVIAPLFPDQEFTKAINRHRSAIQQRQDDPEGIAESVGKAAVFGSDHAYGEITTLKTLGNIDAGTIRAFHAHYFRPENGYLVFVGDIDEKEARTFAEKHFGKWMPDGKTVDKDAAGEFVPGMGGVLFLREPKMPAVYRQVVVVDRPGAPQSIIRVSYPFNLKPKDIRALDAQVLNTILGGGVFNARLMQNLREDKGFTYGAYSSMESDRFNGSFTASTSVRTEVTAQAVTEILAEMQRLRDEPVPHADIDLAKRYMAGSFARSLEDPRTVARFALNTYLNGLPQDHYATYLQRLEKVTVDDILRAANAFLLPENAVVFVVGDLEKIRRAMIPISMEPFIPLIELDVEGQAKEDHLVAAGDTTAQQVMDRYLDAIGGSKAVAKISTMERQMTGNMGKADVVITEQFGKNTKYRKTIVADNRVLQQVVCNGSRAVDVQSNIPQEVEGDRLRELMLWAHPVPEVLEISAPIERFMDGRTTIGEKSVYRITTNVGEIDVTTDYFDVNTGLKVRRIVRQLNLGQFYTVTTDYSDYREVDGVLFPHTIDEDGGITGVIQLKVASIKTGLVFNDDRFVISKDLGSE